MNESQTLIKMFHDPVRLGHYLVYKTLERERNQLFQKIIKDYEITPMDCYELEKMILSDHYLQLNFPKDSEENFDSIQDYVRRKKKLTRMVS
jgi:ABC-type phosphate/phosphonate transport system substrate-binding protein